MGKCKEKGVCAIGWSHRLVGLDQHEVLMWMGCPWSLQLKEEVEGRGWAL